jgi:hypothetical protein
MADAYSNLLIERHADGYAVTGWPREDDFDYDNWVPR